MPVMQLEAKREEELHGQWERWVYWIPFFLNWITECDKFCETNLNRFHYMTRKLIVVSKTSWKKWTPLKWSKKPIPEWLILIGLAERNQFLIKGREFFWVIQSLKVRWQDSWTDPRAIWFLNKLFTPATDKIGQQIHPPNESLSLSLRVP